MIPAACYPKPNTTLGASFIGPLDAYASTLSGGISFSRRLFASYTRGKLIRVRRSSDNAESDIGSIATGLLDIAALLTFCGVGHGFVVKGYDQIGSNDFVQTTASQQPKIVNAGSVLTYNGQPAAVGDGVDDVMTATTNVDWTAGTFSLVHYVLAGAGGATKPFSGDDTSAYAWHYASATVFSGAGLTAGSYSNGTGYVFGANLNGASSYMRNLSTTVSGNLGGGGVGKPNIFGRPSSAIDFYNGAVNELVWKGVAALSNGNLDALMASQRSSYGL